MNESMQQVAKSIKKIARVVLAGTQPPCCAALPRAESSVAVLVNGVPESGERPVPLSSVQATVAIRVSVSK